jgi:hypothetical protein
MWDNALMLGIHAPTFLDYYSKLARRISRDAHAHLWGAAVPLVIAVIVAILQAKFGMIRREQTWSAAIVNASPYAAILVVYLLFHLARAPWKLDQERHSEIVRLTERLSTLETYVDSLKPKLQCTGMGPPIHITTLVVQNAHVCNSNTDVPNIAKQVSATIPVPIFIRRDIHRAREVV